MSAGPWAGLWLSVACTCVAINLVFGGRILHRYSMSAGWWVGLWLVVFGPAITVPLLWF